MPNTEREETKMNREEKKEKRVEREVPEEEEEEKEEEKEEEDEWKTTTNTTTNTKTKAKKQQQHSRKTELSKEDVADGIQEKFPSSSSSFSPLRNSARTPGVHRTCTERSPSNNIKENKFAVLPPEDYGTGVGVPKNNRLAMMFGRASIAGQRHSFLRAMGVTIALPGTEEELR